MKNQTIVFSAKYVKDPNRVTIQIVDLDAFITADRYVTLIAISSRDNHFTCEKGDLSDFRIEFVDQ